MHRCIVATRPFIRSISLRIPRYGQPYRSRCKNMYPHKETLCNIVYGERFVVLIDEPELGGCVRIVEMELIDNFGN